MGNRAPKGGLVMKLLRITVLMMGITILMLASCATTPIRTDAQIEPAVAQVQEPLETIVAESSPEPSEETPDVLEITWQTTAEPWRGLFGTRQVVLLPPNGEMAPVHGIGTFGMDSSIGSAAVSLGLLTYADGGTVIIEIREGPEYVKGSQTYDGWNTVFVFIDDAGNQVLPPEVPVIDIPEEQEPFVAGSVEEPGFFTVRNSTGTTLTYLDIYTNDMMAVDEVGYNLLEEFLPHESVIRIFLEEHPDLKEAVLYRYGQLFHVLAEGETGDVYYREWYPDFDSLEFSLSEEHRYEEPADEQLPDGTIRFENITDYAILDIYVLTPEMEDSLDFSFNLLASEVLPARSYIDFRSDELSYLDGYLTETYEGYLLVIAYDEDDYIFERLWYPAYEKWVITMTEDAFYGY